MQGLAKSIAWDGEGATCLIEVCFLCQGHLCSMTVDLMLLCSLTHPVLILYISRA